jgi:hypothetical protein
MVPLPETTPQARVERFQAAKGFDVMILSPHAGGVGLTFTRANHVIHLSRWWNPAVEINVTVARSASDRRNQSLCTFLSRHSDRAVALFDQNLHSLVERKRRLMHETLVLPEATESERQRLLEGSLAGAPP